MAIRKIVSRSIGVDVIAAEDLANNSVTAAEITDGAVTVNKIGSGAVTSAKMNGLTGASSGIIQADGDGSLSTTTVDVNNITGNVDISGNVTVGTNDSIFAENNVRFNSSGAAYIDMATTGQNINFRVSESSTLDTTAMSIDSDGVILKPNQPAFVAGGDAATTLGAAYNALEFKTVRQNIGSHYNSTNGKFTAPVDGYYMITCHLCPTGHAQGQVLELFIQLNGAAVTRWFLDRQVKQTTTSSNDFSVGGSVVVNLSANDYIEASHVGGTSSATIEGSSIFSGYLLG